METVSIKIEAKHPEAGLDLVAPAGVQSAGEVISVRAVPVSFYVVVAEKAADFVAMVAGIYKPLSRAVRRGVLHIRHKFCRVVERYRSVHILHVGGLRL